MTESFPLTPLQQAMAWNLRSAPHAGIDIEQWVVRLREAVDPPLLFKAFRQSVAAHGVLRTRLDFRDPLELKQSVLGQVDGEFVTLDWRGLSDEAFGRRFAEWLAVDRRRGFDPSAAPLWRITLIHTRPDDFRFICTYHHVLLDGRSLVLLGRECFDRYDALRRGEERIETHEPPFAAFVRRRQGFDAAATLSYFRQSLGHPSHDDGPSAWSAAELPGVAEHRSAAEHYSAAQHHGLAERRGSAEIYGTAEETPAREIESRLSAAESERLERFAQSVDVTPHTLVQAAWAWTLSIHTGCDDHVFASVRACRKWPVTGIENMIGMLINTVPFRAVVDWDVPLIDWLRSLRERQMELRSHESVGLVEIARGLGRSVESPLCPTLLMFTDRPIESMFEVDGRPHSTRSATLYERTDFPLALSVDWRQGARFRLEYRTKLFTADLARSFLDGLVRFLDELPAVVDRPVSAVAPIDHVQRRILAEHAATAGDSTLDRPITCSVPELVARRAADRPTATAVVAPGRTWTYGELDRHAAETARRLAGRGVVAGDRVAVCLPRSPELLAAVLGIWRIGGVYVPLDPKLPAGRLARMLSDAEPKAVVVSADTRQKMKEAGIAALPAAQLDAAAFENAGESVGVAPLPAPPQSIGYQCNRGEGGRRPGEGETLLGRRPSSAETCIPSAAMGVVCDASLPIAVQLDRPAVVLYTSGSTGMPKGVVLTHRNLANHHAYALRRWNVGPNDRLAPVSSIGVDASLEEMFLPLSAGGEVHLTDAETLGSFERLLEFVRSRKLTILDVPTSLWRELTNYLFETHERFPESIRLIVLGGERATQAAYRRFLKVGGDLIRWVNCYGPTETTIFSLAHEHDPRRDSASTAAPPIGRPIDNTIAYVVDRRGRPVPPGVVGELLIGGAGVAQGYWNRPELTTERFIDAPSELVPPGRYYRTGDAVRLRADGRFEYVGRLDSQVKLRGFRIEPAEIESVLLRHAAVRDAAVTVRTSAVGTTMLVAYVVAHRGATFDAQSLRLFAAENLPDYMVPTAWVDLEELPLSAHGKVDLGRLPEPIFAEAPPPSREPTEFEQRIIAAWRTALGIDQVRLNDDFFELGGDSLRAMALSARLETELDRRVPVNLLFHARTPERVAAELTSGDLDLAPLVLLREGDRSRPLFLIHSLGGDVWIYCDLVRQMKSEAAIFGLQLAGLNRVGTTPETLAACAEENLRYVREIQPAGPYRFAGYSSGGLVALEMAAQLRRAGEAVEFLGLIDTGLPPAVEQQRTFSRREKLRKMVGGLPARRLRLTQLDLRGVCRRIVRFAIDQAGKLLAKPRSEEFELTDRDLLECFAEDISTFPAYRLDLIRKHYLAIERYEPQPYEGAAHVFRSERQPLFTVQTATLGWELVVRGKLSTKSIRGAHATIMRQPHVADLAAALDDALVSLALPGAARPKQFSSEERRAGADISTG